jgi:hypothetical protein
MSKNISKKNLLKLRLFLASQEKTNDVKANNTKVRGTGAKPSSN